LAYSHDNLYFSLSTPLGKDKLLLRNFQGQERISGLFHFTLDLESEDPNLDFSAIVGQSATITVELADGSQRFINGVVGRFQQAGNDPIFTRYQAELYPWLWLLTMSVDCRIFQNKSTPDILSELFKELGFSDFKIDLTGSYQPREYCVQYNESVFEFASRLLEEEGIFFYFEHQDGKHTLVMADDLGAFKSCAGAATLEYGTWGEWTQQNVVTHCTLDQCVIPGVSALDDFNFETPSTNLMATTDSTTALNGSKRRVYEYPGGFLKKNAGEDRSGLRIEEHEQPAKVLVGRSYCRAFVCGGKFNLEKHYRDDVNASYVLSRVSHSGTWEGYSNSFEAFPSDVPFRPARTSRKPTIPGTQTALVVGKKGEEIWCDKYGRVKVQFHWDQLGKNDENSSCWIRVAHGWAGKSWGMIAVPRIGHEVVVSFLEGDPDRPLITGSVYNAETTVPYALPDNQTQSTWKSNSSKGGDGYNEIRFEDMKSAEEIWIHAQKDENIVVENDKTEEVGHDESISIGHDRTETVKNNERLTVQNNRTRNVTKVESVSVGKNQTLAVGANRSVSVDKNEDRSVVKNQDISVGDHRTSKVGKNDKLEVGKNLSIEAGDQIVISTGKAKIVMKKDGTITISGKDITFKGTGKITGKASKDLVLKGSKVIAN